MRSKDIQEARRRVRLLAASRAQKQNTEPLDVDAILDDFVREVAARVEANPVEKATVLAAHDKRMRKAARRAERA